MKLASICALAFAFRVVWGANSLRRNWKSASGWSPLRKKLVAVEIFSSAGAPLCALALWTGNFAPWMLWPVGAGVLLTIPLPCYFEAVDHIRWLHLARIIFFTALALFFFAVASSLI